MANTEKRDYRETLHCLMAFRRRKDNPDGDVRCFREIIKDAPVDLKRLKAKCETIPGNWRIHRTVNARSVAKAYNVLMHRLIDNPKDAEALETVWKTCLLQKEARAERKFMIDVDPPAKIEQVKIDLTALGISILEIAMTPSGGFHIVTVPFDSRELENTEGVSIQRDGYIFLEEFFVR